MWTKDQARKHQAALAVAEKREATIANLEELAKHAPAFAERIAELRIMRDNLHALAATAVAIDPKGS